MLWKHFLFISLCGRFFIFVETTSKAGTSALIHSREKRAQSLTPGGTNVCAFKQTKTVYESREVVVTSLVKKRVCCSKWITCWKKCDRSTPVTKKVVQTFSKNVEYNTYHCCEGWTVDASGTQCAKALCNPYCRNNGICNKPNKCLCKNGFEGRFCQLDINECLVPTLTGCSQQCINLPGTFSCGCKRGFIAKDTNSKTCADIDECKHNPCACYGDNCVSECQNTIGSYRCKCGSGYRLSRSNLCTDRNECFENPDICPHRCINTPGSYKCTCFRGFTWNTNTKKCDSIDSCAIGNGGCLHHCIPIIGGNTCACKRGFYLASDRYSCTDFNECNGLTECDATTSTCINTPGDYHCKCKMGFKYASNNRTCEDRDECSEAIDKCDHQCHNAFGSYTCSCRHGYRLMPDGRSCQDIDECQSNRCDQKCVNMIGSFRCDCNPGYILDIDGKSCKPQLCEELLPPVYGFANCDGRSMGKTCRFSCRHGYELQGTVTRSCLASGKWSGTEIKCQPKACDVPRPPLNGKLTLPCDLSYQSTCPVSCNRGYRLRGPDVLFCSIENDVLTWNASKSYCEEILVCKPNPCQNGGSCRIETYTTYTCNCTGTGHVGKNCETGLVTLPQFPKMQVGIQSSILVMKAMPKDRVSVTMVADPGITLSPSTVVITRPASQQGFTVTASTPGLKKITYYVTSDEKYVNPPMSVLLAFDASADSSVNSLVPLDPGCFKVTLSPHVSLSCSTVQLHSSLPWQRNGQFASTQGASFVIVGQATFPLALPGIDVVKILASLRHYADVSVASSATSCVPRPLTEAQLQHVAKSDVLMKDALEQFNKLTPSWFSISLREQLTHFTEESAQAKLMSGKELQQHSACATMSIEPKSLFIVYLHREHLVIKVHSKEVLLRSAGMFCIAIDMCRQEPHLALPKDSLGHMENVLSFHEIQALGWHVSVQSIGFARNSPFESTRQCLMPAKRTPGSSASVVFGGVSMTATYKTSFKGRLTGNMAVGIESINGKEDMLSRQQCMDGNTRFETPAWFSTDIPKNIYESKSIAQHLTSLKQKTLSETDDELSLLQHRGTMFHMKSGLRPILRKTSEPVSITVAFKSTKTSTTTSGDDNFGKVNQIEMLFFPVMDLESLLLGMSVMTPSLSTEFEAFKMTVSDWSLTLSDDINDLYMNIDNSQLVSDKLKTHYYKATTFLPDLKAMITKLNDDLSSVIPSAYVALMDAKATDIDVMITAIEPSIVSQQSPKLFQTLALQFNGSVCLYLPCIQDTIIHMYPLSKDVGMGQFCSDPSRGPFDMWQTKATLLRAQSPGDFLEFDAGKSAHLCLAIDGVNKARFEGSLKLFGNKLHRSFVVENKRAIVSKSNMKLFGKYQFQVNATVDLSLKDWRLASVAVKGVGFGGSTFLNALQGKLDRLSVTQYYTLEKRVEKARRTVLEMEKEKIILQGQVQSDVRRANEARAKANVAETTFTRKQSEYNFFLSNFKNFKTELATIENAIKNECQISSCPLGCVKVEKCDVCQKSVFINKTLPACKVLEEDRSYTHLKTFKSVCSHVVEDRTLKYTGNCKKPGPEREFAKAIIAKINKKIKNNQSLTIEDALYLQQVNHTAGTKLLKAIQQSNFFKSFSRRLLDGALSEDDFKRLAEYKNASFAEKMRQQMQEIIKSKVLNGIALKLNQSKKLTEADFAKIKAVDPELETKLRQSQSMQLIQERLASGKNLTEEDLAFLNSTNPEQARNITEAIKQAQLTRGLMADIQRKISAGKLSPQDITALEKINPSAADKLKKALKEQLTKTVEEMERNMKNVKNAINQGFNNSEFTTLTDQLNTFTNGMKPIDKAELEALQRKLKASNATQGTVLEELAERLDLALSIGNLTGLSTDLKRVSKSFFGVLARVELPEMLQSSQTGILEGIKHLQDWYTAASQFFEKLCSNCGDDCNNEHTFQSVLGSLRDGLAQFKSKVCTGGWSLGKKIPGISSVCNEAENIQRFLSNAGTMTTSECSKINRQVIQPLRKISDLFKGTRIDVVKAFEEAWQNQPRVVSALGSYKRASTTMQSTYATLLGASLPVPTKSAIINEVNELTRSRDVSVKVAEYEAALAATKRLAKVIESIPKEMKRLAIQSLPSTVDAATTAALKKEMATLRKALIDALKNLCPDKSLDDVKLLSALLGASDKELGTLLASRSFDDIFTNSQRLGSILAESVRLSGQIKIKVATCVKTIKTVNPFQDLKKFLESVMPLAKRTYKDIVKDVKKAMANLKNGVKSPVGKLLKSMESFIENSPKFNLPLILSMRPASSLVTLTSVENYFAASAGLFKGLLDVSKQCKDCRPEEIFGKSGLKSIAEKFDRYLKPISKNVSRFFTDVSYNLQGISLLHASLERLRTGLQTIYKSDTGMNADGIDRIAQSFSKAKDAVKDVKQGYSRLYNAWAGIDNKKINQLKKDVNAVGQAVVDMYKKSDGALSELKDVFTSVNNAQKFIKNLPDKFEEIGQGPIEARLNVIKEVGKGIKELTQQLPKLVTTKLKNTAQVFFDGEFLDTLAPKLQSIANTVDGMTTETSAMMNLIGVKAPMPDASQGFNAVQFKSSIEQLKRAPAANRAAIAQSMQRKTEKSESFLSNVVDGAKDIYKDVAGFVSDVKAKFDQLKKRMEKYAVIYRDVMATVKELKKGPLSEIGEIKDAAKELIDSLSDYNLAKLMTAEPGVAKRKVKELKELFSLSASTLSSIDTILKQCKSCKVENIVGYRFIGDMAKNLEGKFEWMLSGLEKLADVADDTIGEMRTTSTAVSSIRDRFKAITKSGQFNSKTLQDLSKALTASSPEIDKIVQGAENMAKLLLAQDVDFQVLHGNLNSVVTKLSDLASKSSVVLGNVETVKANANSMKAKFDQLRRDAIGLKRGPLKTRLEVAKAMSHELKNLVGNVPKIFGESVTVLESLGVNTDWITGFGNNLESMTKAVNSMTATTDKVLNAAGYAVTGVDDVKQKLPSVKAGFKAIADAPWDQKLMVANNAMQQASGIFDIAFNAISKVANEFNVDLTKDDLIDAAETVVGKQRLEKFRNIFNTTTKKLQQLQQGPISEIGKLTDAVEGFVDGLDGFDISKALLSDPASLRNKVSEFQQLAQSTGDILASVTDITGVCTGCNLEKVLGKDFAKKLSNTVGKKFQEMQVNIADIAGRVKVGYNGWEQFVNTSETLSSSFKSLDLKDGKITPQTFDKAAAILKSSALNMQKLKGASSDIFKALFDDDKDLAELESQFSGLIDQVGGFMNKTSIVSENVADVYQTGLEVKNIFNSIEKNVDGINKGPLEVRVGVARKILGGVDKIMKIFPTLLNQSTDLGTSLGMNGTWMRRFGSRLTSVAGSVSKVLQKTDSVLEGVGLTAQGVTNITGLTKGIQNDFQQLLAAPWKEKFKIFQRATDKMNNVLSQANGVASNMDKTMKELTGKSFNISNGLGYITDSVSGFIANVTKSVKFVEEVFIDVTNTIDAIKSGPIEKIGALTDSTKELFKSLDQYNLAEILLMAPGTVKGKLGEIKEIISESGVILRNISDIVTKVCPSCNFDDILGSSFVKNVTSSLENGFKKLSANVVKVVDKVGEGAIEVQGITQSVQGIQDGINKLKHFKLNSEGFKNAADILTSSSKHVEDILDRSNNIYRLMFNDSLDLQLLKGKFEGFVSTMTGMMNKVGNFSDKVGDAFKSVEDVAKIFKQVGTDFDSITKGPIESRLAAVQNVIKGVDTVLGSLPNILNKASLGLDSTAFLRKFGKQVSDLTGGIRDVLNKTSLVVGDVGQAISGVQGIGNTVAQIDQKFGQLLSAPLNKKFEIAKDMINSAKLLTGQVNGVASNVNSAIQTVTGKVLFTGNIFGNGTADLLDKMSNGVSLIADRYGKFQILTKTIGEAFNNISSDPVKFALEGLPKLFKESEEFINLLLNDTRGIAASMGLELDKFNLDPAIVKAAKNFYGFAKTTLGAIQNGKDLVTNFQKLFDSKNFKEAMVNFQKLTDSGTGFIKNLDELGGFIFKGDWNGMKDNFQETMNDIGESLGINMENVGEMFTKAFGVVSSALSAANSIEQLLKMKEFNLETVMHAAKAAMQLAKSAVSLMNHLGANIGTKALESAMSKVNVVVAVVQIVKGVSDFIKWVNDVCDITYESVVIPKNLTYVCLKEKLEIEDIKVKVEQCEYVVNEIAAGFGEPDYCCHGKQCVYIQSPSCLKQNKECLEKRLKKAKDIPNVRRDLIVTYEGMRLSQLAMETATINKKAARFLESGANLSWNRTSASLYRLYHAHARANESYFQMNRDLITLGETINKFSNKSKIVLRQADFNVVLYRPSTSRIPMKLTAVNHLGKNVIFNSVVDLVHNHDDYMQSVARMILTNSVKYVPYHRRRRSTDSGAFHQLSLEGWAAKCGIFTEFMATVNAGLDDLEGGVSAVLSQSSPSRARSSSAVIVKTSSSPEAAANELIDELKRQNTATSPPSLFDLLRNWKASIEMQMLADVGETCVDYTDCVDAFFDNVTAMLDPSMQGYDVAKASSERVKQTLLSLLSASTQSELGSRIIRLRSLISTLERSVGFCHSAPKFTSLLPPTTVAYEGKQLSLDCSATSLLSVTYQWLRNETVLPNQVDRRLVVESLTSDDRGYYRCVAISVIGETSSPSTLVIVRAYPVITRQPKDVTVVASDRSSVNFVCNATESSNIVYEWKHTSYDSSVVTTVGYGAALRLKTVTLSEAGFYWCEVNDGNVVVPSRKANLFVVSRSSKRDYVTLSISIQATAAEVKRGSCGLPDSLDTNSRSLSRGAEQYLRRILNLTMSRDAIAIEYYKETESGRSAKLRVEISVETQSTKTKTDEVELAMAAANQRTTLQQKLDGLLQKSNDGRLLMPWGDCQWGLKAAPGKTDWLAEEMACPRGMNLDGDRLQCLSCPPGTFDDGKGDCSPCAIGSYQTASGSTDCIPCPNGQLTSNSGSAAASMCIEKDVFCYGNVDLVVVMDAANDLGSNSFAMAKAFVGDLVRRLNNTAAQVQVSVVLSGKDPILSVNDLPASSSELANKISSLQLIGAGRRFDLSVRLARKIVGGDSDVVGNYRRVILSIVGGAPTPSRLKPSYLLLGREADLAKDEGIDLYTVRVGSQPSPRDVVSMTSLPLRNRLFSIPGFNDLQQSSAAVSNMICNEN